MATERAKRPIDFKKKKAEHIVLPEFKSECAFCPGNEKTTPTEIFRIGDKKIWKTRVIYNKFPALSPEEKDSRELDGMFRSMGGFGIHEIIIESPKHNIVIPLMTDEEVIDIINTYKERYLAVQRVKNIEAITIFKNHGPEAGTSLEHPHSQLIATPIVPPNIRNRITRAMNYFDETGKCIFCETLQAELKAKSRIVLESDNFVAFIPYASLSPFNIWLFPRRHGPSFAAIDDKEIKDLARALKNTWKALYSGLDNPDLNFTINSTPLHDRSTDYFHWYINIIPRVTKVAGFELGSGIYINVALPEESAGFLREVLSHG